MAGSPWWLYGVPSPPLVAPEASEDDDDSDGDDDDEDGDVSSSNSDKMST